MANIHGLDDIDDLADKYYWNWLWRCSELIFRGCAEAMYEHDYGCDTDLQAVDVIDQRGAVKQVDVEVNICFCSSQNCNEVLSAAGRKEISLASSLLLLAALYYVNWPVRLLDHKIFL